MKLTAYDELVAATEAERQAFMAMLGMVHVLEGLSAQLALGAAHKLRASVGAAGEGGFSYLASHGRLDQQHVALFRALSTA